MYQEVYIDLVFAANLLMDYILLRLTGIILKYQGSRRRCLAAAVAGALFSCLCLYVRTEINVFTVIVRITWAGVMMRVAYGIRDMKRLAGAVLFFFGITFLTGGFWKAVSGNGRVTFFVFALCAAGTYGGLSLMLIWLERLKVSRENLYPVILRFKGRELKTYGLYDTGNLLNDPMTKLPVSVADTETMKSLLSEDLIERLKHFKEHPEEIESTEIADLKPHYLSFQTVGREMQLILAVTLEDLCIQTPGERIHVSEPVLALSSEPFALGREYKVILNSRLLH